MARNSSSDVESVVLSHPVALDHLKERERERKRTMGLESGSSSFLCFLWRKEGANKLFMRYGEGNPSGSFLFKKKSKVKSQKGLPNKQKIFPTFRARVYVALCPEPLQHPPFAVHLGGAPPQRRPAPALPLLGGALRVVPPGVGEGEDAALHPGAAQRRRELGQLAAVGDGSWKERKNRRLSLPMMLRNTFFKNHKYITSVI